MTNNNNLKHIFDISNHDNTNSFISLLNKYNNASCYNARVDIFKKIIQLKNLCIDFYVEDLQDIVCEIIEDIQSYVSDINTNIKSNKTLKKEFYKIRDKVLLNTSFYSLT